MADPEGGLLHPRHRPALGLGVVALFGLALPAFGAHVATILGAGRTWPLESVHHGVEAAIASISLLLAGLLWPTRDVPGRSDIARSLAVGLAVLGFLGGAHGAMHAGNSFVFLYSAALLVGGLAFALVLVPAKALLWPLRGGVILLAVVAEGAAIFAPDWLPSMVVDGQFTDVPRAMNFAGGLLFWAAAGRLAVLYAREPSWRGIALLTLATLFGTAGAAFVVSTPWDASWWLWHTFRVGASCVALVMVVASWLRGRRQEVALRQAEERARATERSFRALIEGSPDGVLLFRDGRFTYVNPAAEEIFGRPAAELVGAPARTFFAQEDHATFLGCVAELVLGGPGCRCEVLVLRPDGASVPVEAVSVLLELSGLPTTALQVRGVEEARKLTANMMKLDRMAAVGTLAAGVGHEVANPLTYVLANLDRARRVAGSGDEASADELHRALDRAIEGAERIRTIVGQLRAFSRLDREVKEREVDLVEVIESAMRMASNEIRHRARLVTDFRPTPAVRASEAHLGQVFLNLIVNAAQALPMGEVQDHTIHLRVYPDGADAVAEVEDDGSGIPAADLERIFEPFFTTKPEGQGTGLGLSICKETVEAAGGRLEVDSEPGRGSLFRVRLPASAGPVEGGLQSSSGEALPALRRLSVLVVDDEPLVAEALSDLLAPLHDVATASRGQEVLDRLEGGARYDVILCDLMMPEMTGMELHEVLVRRHPEQAALMLFMTGGAFSPQAGSFLDRMGDRVLPKPPTPKQLLRRLAEVGSERPQ